MDKNKYDIENDYVVFKDSRKPVHRWVAEKKYGNIDGKEVHHIDGDKRNNDKSNLLAVTQEDHYQITQHNNKINVFLDIIGLLAITYFMSLLLPKNPAEYSIVRIIAVGLILLLAIELRYGFFSKWIRRPNES
jgi:hypothetical protein